MNRKTIAFLIAPLWVPAIMTSLALLFEPASGFLLITIIVVVSTVTTYLGALAIGLPLYNFLLSHKLTAVWIAAPAGAIVANIAGVFPAFGLGVWSLGFSETFNVLVRAPVDWRSFIMPTVLGSIVGQTLWGIARPDKEAAQPPH